MAAEALPGPAPCFHCGLPIPIGLRLSAEVLGEPRPMCCIGCCAVAEMLEAQGLSQWYARRSDPTGVPAATLPDVLERVAFLETPGLDAEFIEFRTGDRAEASFWIEGLRCAACVWVIERHLEALGGVKSVRVSLATHRARIEWDPDRLGLRDIIVHLAEIGFVARPDRPGEGAKLEQRENRSALIRLGVAGLGAMNVMTYSVALYAGHFEGMAAGFEGLMRWMGLLVSTPVVVVSARPFFSAAWRDLRLGRPGMDVPVSLAIGGAYGVSVLATMRGEGEVFFDSVCMFTFFLSLGRILEMRIRHRSASMARRMIDATPTLARRESQGGEQVVPARGLVVGDRVRVRPGEVMPADGRVLEGHSSVEEALLTGEPWPRSVSAGDAVVAGSINVESPLRVEVARAGDDTTLASILRLMERAQSERPPIARAADRVAGIFVSGVLGVALLNFLAWQMLAPDRAIWTTLAVLVATCPCALSLATPTALTAATHGLARAGLLITSARALEGLATADRFVFDKTGTLTRGEPTLSRVIGLRGHAASEVLGIARRLERDSEHPVARAFEADPEASSEPIPEPELTGIRAVPGSGIEGIASGQRIRIGRPDWAWPNDPGATHPEVSQDPTQVWVLLADEKGPLAWFGLDDPIRPEVQGVMSRLRSSGLALEILSGDPSAATHRVARLLGLEVVRMGATPEEKVDRVRELQFAGETVIVVGDGINDAPLLRAGDVGIAMGSGADLSRLGADAVLMNDELDLLPRAVEAAKRMRRVLFQNFGWAIAYNVIALPLAVTGQLAPWLAAFGMSASSLVVVLNALRLNRLPEAP